ncbi:hypothetical protein BB559_002411 [Furculomyces boomerangus]|uniref:ADF-H domain-containing protein n=1 Tax=Furculomyces boomerangus TaxID=61424 RepID=A0A2T9YVJ0_9FUNG|nr:hypothetical protein BB559_005571 [Furculomyces boomerangus]PVU96355.1 hypothetical protein BB559_002411 [Furculomyces boomerangus]
MSIVCEIDSQVLTDVRKTFRTAVNTGFNVCLAKIDRKKLLIVPDKVLTGVSIEDVVDELPDDSPRYLTLSYKMITGDGRASYPLVFIYYCPPTTSPELAMLYASSQQIFQNRLNLGKVYMLHESEELTEEWLNEKLLKFGN